MKHSKRQQKNQPDGDYCPDCGTELCHLYQPGGHHWLGCSHCRLSQYMGQNDGSEGWRRMTPRDFQIHREILDSCRTSNRLETPQPDRHARPSLDSLSRKAIQFYMHARKHGVTWIHPCLIDYPGPARELIEAGYLIVRPQLVHPVTWPWEEVR